MISLFPSLQVHHGSRRLSHHNLKSLSNGRTWSTRSAHLALHANTPGPIAFGGYFLWHQAGFHGFHVFSGVGDQCDHVYQNVGQFDERGQLWNDRTNRFCTGTLWILYGCLYSLFLPDLNFKFLYWRKNNLWVNTYHPKGSNFSACAAEGTGRIWKKFWLLSVVTIIELVLGLGFAKHWHMIPKQVIQLFSCKRSYLYPFPWQKPFYIVSVFMHPGMRSGTLWRSWFRYACSSGL